VTGEGSLCASFAIMRWFGGRATRARLAMSLSCSALALVGLVEPDDASASEPDGSNLSRAHDAYARGAAAYAQQDYERAAREFATADELVPAAVTLRVALEAVTLADDPVLGMELIERAHREPTDAQLARAVAIAQQRFVHRTGSLVVRCDDCLAVIDGSPATVGQPRRVLPGVHTVSVQRHGSPETRLVPVLVDDTREVLVRARSPEGEALPPIQLSPLPPSVLPPAEANRGVSPAWFVAASIASVGLAAVTVWSALDTTSDHQAFENQGCSATDKAGCNALASAGQGAQTRTLALGIGTGAAIVGTTLLGAVAVRWHAPTGREVGLALTATSAALRVTF
jgi:hypothetical protein